MNENEIPVQVLPYMGKPQKLIDDERAKKEIKFPRVVNSGIKRIQPRIPLDENDEIV